MPNKANKSKDQSNIVKPKRKTTKASIPNPNGEQPGKQQGDTSKGAQGNANEASNQGGNVAADSNPND